MKRYLTGGACAAIAGAALIFSLGATPAQAQRGGSYLRTCTHVRAHGDRIVADCRRAGGGWNRTVLRDADACVGDISNQNGYLTCSRRGYGSEHDRYGRYDRYDRYDHRYGYGSDQGPGRNRSPYWNYYGR